MAKTPVRRLSVIRKSELQAIMRALDTVERILRDSDVKAAELVDSVNILRMQIVAALGHPAES